MRANSSLLVTGPAGAAAAVDRGAGAGRASPWSWWSLPGVRWRLGRWPNSRCAALRLAWRGGWPEGVADLLFGAASPSGRLAVTLPAHPGNVPLTYAAEPTGRPYPGHFAKFRTAGWICPTMRPASIRLRAELRAGWGHGPPRLSRAKARADQAANLQIMVTNTAARAVTETVQLYASDPVARITRAKAGG